MNPSRVDPALIGLSTRSRSPALVLPGTTDSFITFTTAIIVTESQLRNSVVHFSEDRKFIEGIPHAVEFERMSAVFCMAFGLSELNGQMAKDAITFSTARPMTTSKFHNLRAAFPLTKMVRYRQLACKKSF